MNFYLNGVIYENNTMVNLSTIGVDSRALVCLIPCCKKTGTDWLLPSRKKVKEGPNWYAYERQNMRLLSRITSTLTSLHTGVYTCTAENKDGKFILNILGYTDKYPGTV